MARGASFRKNEKPQKKQQRKMISLFQSGRRLWLWPHVSPANRLERLYFVHMGRDCHCPQRSVTFKNCIITSRTDLKLWSICKFGKKILQVPWTPSALLLIVPVMFTDAPLRNPNFSKYSLRPCYSASPSTKFDANCVFFGLRSGKKMVWQSSPSRILCFTVSTDRQTSSSMENG